MIAVDTSALGAIAFGEEEGAACRELLLQEPAVIAAPTMLELVAVGWRRGGRELRQEFARLIEDFEIKTIPFDVEMMTLAVEAFDTYGGGGGLQPSVLGWADCFSYALAKALSVPLLYIGNDFPETDIVPALTTGAR